MTIALWNPTDTIRSNSQILDLMAHFNQQYGRSINNYDQLHRFSVDRMEDFWDGVWDHLNLIGEKTGPVLINKKSMPGAKFK